MITFRNLTSADFPMVARWLAEPHVARWWRHDPTVDEVAYMASDPQTAIFIAMVDRGQTPPQPSPYQGEGATIGLVQSYLVDDYPDHAESVDMPGAVGIDLFIGEPSYVGRDLDRR